MAKLVKCTYCKGKFVQFDQAINHENIAVEKIANDTVSKSN